MRDPYLYEDIPVLKNLLGIRDADTLRQADADITGIRLFTVDAAIQEAVSQEPRLQAFGIPRLLAIHRHIFCDVFDWAGTFRTIPIEKGERVLGGDTVRYSPPEDIERDCTLILDTLNAADWRGFRVGETALAFAKYVAALWQVHPFREGNTRTVIAFTAQFAEAHGFRMDKTLLKDSSAYVRDALVKASDGQYSEYGHLAKIMEDAIRRG
jgi:cell filamentation protein